MKYFRKKFRFNRYRRRSFRRSFRKFPKPGTKRFFKRQRRNALPEIKWSIVKETNDGGDVVQPLAWRTDFLTPASIDQGPDVNQRIGKVVKFRKVATNFYVYSKNPDTGVGLNNSGYFRLTIWAPAKGVVYDDAAAHIGSLPITGNIDFTIIRVFSDKYIPLGYNQFYRTVGPNGGNVSFSNPQSSVKLWRQVIPFPRTINFANPNSLVDPGTERLYFTVQNPNSYPVQILYQAKTTWIDP